MRLDPGAILRKKLEPIRFPNVAAVTNRSMQKLANIIPIKNVSENSILTSLSITRGIKWIELRRRPLAGGGGSRRWLLDPGKSQQTPTSPPAPECPDWIRTVLPSTVRGERDRGKRREGGD